MSTPRKYGTFTELCSMAELFGFNGYMFLIVDSKNYTCYDFGLTGNDSLDETKPTIFLLFDGNIPAGHFRLLQPTSKTRPSSTFTGKYEVLMNETSTDPQQITTIQRLRETARKASESVSEDTANNQCEDKEAPTAFLCDVCQQ